MIVRSAAFDDRLRIRYILETAFGRKDEADLVDSLTAGNMALLSLVAEDAGELHGHILFSRMSIDSADCSTHAVALAPVAVLPEYQRRGIAGQLIRHGLGLLRDRGAAIVTVLGEPEYYTRFGFSSKLARLLESPFPPEAYMAVELIPGALNGVRGKVIYPPAFGL